MGWGGEEKGGETERERREAEGNKAADEMVFTGILVSVEYTTLTYEILRLGNDFHLSRFLLSLNYLYSSASFTIRQFKPAFNIVFELISLFLFILKCSM